MIEFIKKSVRKYSIVSDGVVIGELLKDKYGSTYAILESEGYELLRHRKFISGLQKAKNWAERYFEWKSGSQLNRFENPSASEQDITERRALLSRLKKIPHDLSFAIGYMDTKDLKKMIERAERTGKVSMRNPIVVVRTASDKEAEQIKRVLDRERILFKIVHKGGYWNFYSQYPIGMVKVLHGAKMLNPRRK